MERGTPSRSSTGEYYDRFLVERMLAYRVSGSPRLEAAWNFIRSRVRATSRILDVGCGIGLMSERMARVAHRGFVHAFDLSPANVAYARRTVRRRNLELFQADLLAGLDRVRERLGEPVDLVTMIDVIEHVPCAAHEDLLRRLGEMVVADGALLLTFPSVPYQLHLHRNEPAGLQEVDETIELSDLASVAARSGWHVARYLHVDVWRRNQYVHCELVRELGAEPLPEVTPRRPLALWFRLRNRYRRWKYVDRVMRIARGSNDG